MIKRIYIYLSEMFPPLHFVGTYLFTIIIAAAVCSIQGSPDFIKNPYVHMAAFSVVLMSLMVRIMDEFKDYEDDLINFPDRPLPSGRVKKRDLKVLQTIVISTILLLSVYRVDVIIATLCVLAYGLLMYKWFFIEEKMRKSLPLAFLSHNPVILVKFGFICTVLNSQGYVENMTSTLIGLPLMLTMTNWELSRKLRSPEDETDYTTYSKIWGPKNAAKVSLFIQSLIFSGVIAFLMIYDHSKIIIGLYTIVAGYYASIYIRFIQTLKHTRTFKIHAENLALVTQLTVLISSIVKLS